MTYQQLVVGPVVRHDRTTANVLGSVVLKIIAAKTRMAAMVKFRQLFKSTRCAVIGMIHVKALPGAWRSYLLDPLCGYITTDNLFPAGTPLNKMTCGQIVDAACEEAEIYKDSGVVRTHIRFHFDFDFPPITVWFMEVRFCVPCN